MSGISKNVYFNVLNEIVYKYNKIYHKTIKMKPIDVKSDSFAEYNEESNEKDSKFEVYDHFRISKYQKIFAKGYAPNWSKEIFAVKKTKKYCNLEKKLLAVFYEKELQKTNQKEFRIKKVIKRKRNVLYVKWRGYHNSFNTWIDLIK